MKTKQLHISRTIKLIVFPLVILGCSNQEVSIHSLDKGIYASKKQSAIKSIYYRFVDNSRFTIGDTLTIYDSVNFAYSTCGNYRFGKYEIKNDSLYLEYDSSAAHSDSIIFDANYTHTLYIENDSTLIREFKIKLAKERHQENQESHNAISELHYIGNTVSKE